MRKAVLESMKALVEAPATSTMGVAHLGDQAKKDLASAKELLLRVERALDKIGNSKQPKTTGGEVAAWGKKLPDELSALVADIDMVWARIQGLSILLRQR